MSSSSPPHPQNMLEKPFTYQIKTKYLLWSVGQQPNLFELFGCHCCNASKIVGIGQLPSPLVHPRGHQKWMLDIYKEGGNLTRSTSTSTQLGKPTNTNSAVFFNIVQRGGDQPHVKKNCCKCSIILKGFLAT